jgi:hypothetical protein
MSSLTVDAVFVELLLRETPRLRTNWRGFLGSPLVALGKRLKPIRDRLVGHVSGNAKQGPRSIQILFAQHNRSAISLWPLVPGDEPPNS